MGFPHNSAFNRSEASSLVPTESYRVQDNSTNNYWMTTESINRSSLLETFRNMNNTLQDLKIGRVEVALEVTALSVIFVFGLSMNLAILFLLMRHPKTRSSASIFISNITTTDLLQCICIPINIYGMIMGQWNLGPAFCMVTAAMTSIPYCVSFWGHLGLAFCRYCYLNIKSKTCKALLGKGPVAVVISSMWLLQVVLHWVLVWRDSAPAQVMYLPKYGLCGIVTTQNASGGYMVVTVTTTLNILIPFVACLISYVSVARAVHRQVVAFPSDLARKMYGEVTKYTTLLFGIFCVCWLPEYLRLSFDIEGHSPVWVIRLCSSLIFFNAAINPYIYALRCAAIRRAFIKQFPKIATVLRLADDNLVSSSNPPAENVLPGGSQQPGNVNDNRTFQVAAHGNIVISTIS